MSRKPSGRISRKEFIRRAGIGAAAVGSVAMGLSRTARGVSPPQASGESNPDPANIVPDGAGGWVVYPLPKDDPDKYLLLGENPYSPGTMMTMDAWHVQWAVAHVDTSIAPQPQVLLKSRSRETAEPIYFNFNLDPAPLNDIVPFDPNSPEPSLAVVQAGQVRVFKDVKIVGEKSSAPYAGAFPGGETPDIVPDRTMIYGGYTAFYNHPDPPGTPEPLSTEATKVTVRNIYFAYPSNAAVRVKFCSGLEVSDCVIYDAFGSDAGYLLIELAPGFLAYIPFRIAFGIEATALFLPGSAPFLKPNPYLNGYCRIVNNFIKRKTETNPDFYGWVDCGIVTQFTDMDILVSGNEVHNFPYVGFGLDANTRTATIANNRFSDCGFSGFLHPYIPVFMLDSAGMGARENNSPVIFDSNIIECGYDGGGNMKTQYGVVLTGVSGTTLKSNVIKGILGQGEAGTTNSGIGLFPFIDVETSYSTANSILGNNLKQLLSEETQAEIGYGCDNNVFKNNDYGAVVGMAGVFIGSDGNSFVNENFWGNYPGTLNPDGTPLSPPRPCLWFAEGSTGNTVSALKNGRALQGFDICTQIYFASGYGGNNVTGYEKCAVVPQAVKNAMVSKEAGFLSDWCVKSGGVWDSLSGTCAHHSIHLQNQTSGSPKILLNPDIMKALGYAWNKETSKWE